MLFRIQREYDTVNCNYLLDAVLQADTATQEKEDKMFIVAAPFANVQPTIIITDPAAIQQNCRDYKMWVSFNTLINGDHYGSLFRGVLRMSELMKIHKKSMKLLKKVKKKRLTELEYSSKMNSIYFKLKYYSECGIIKPFRRRVKNGNK